jgi:hypothetical protein
MSIIDNGNEPDFDAPGAFPIRDSKAQSERERNFGACASAEKRGFGNLS